jgi:hypothetical protein
MTLTSIVDFIAHHIKFTIDSIELYWTWAF